MLNIRPSHRRCFGNLANLGNTKNSVIDVHTFLKQYNYEKHSRISDALSASSESCVKGPLQRLCFVYWGPAVKCSPASLQCHGDVRMVIL